MPQISPDGTPNPVSLTQRMTLLPARGWQGTAEVAQPAAVLGEEQGPATTAPLSLFEPAEPAIVLEVRQVPGPAVLSDEPDQGAALEYQPAEKAVYVLLQEVHTPDGIIYDWTLPQRPDVVRGRRVLGEELGTTEKLRFPINPVVGADIPGAPSGSAVLGVEDALGGLVGDLVARRVLQVLKSPIDRALRAGVRRFEGAPSVLALRASFQPLEGFEAWRALLPPGAERRVLLYIHGFGSSTAGSGGSKIISQFGSSYDAILSYDHPTVGRDPLENARNLLAMIPPDLRLAVDLVAHSRGGLVARSLVELADWVPQFRPVRLITHGTPHAGTRLADPERWDRLVSIGTTAASWLASVGGGAFWAPKLLEYILKAAAQGVFALPGLAAMTPDGAFLGRLNAPDAPGLDQRVRYAAVSSTFGISNVAEQGFRQAFTALTVQAFMGEPNDLVVPTASMSAIDKLSRTLTPDQQFKTAVAHSSYFQDAQVVDFLHKQLGA